MGSMPSTVRFSAPPGAIVGREKLSPFCMDPSPTEQRTDDETQASPLDAFLFKIDEMMHAKLNQHPRIGKIFPNTCGYR